MGIEGKVALVTGASRGIGRASAILLGKHGAKVAVNYASSEAEAAEVVNIIKNSGGEAIAVKANVADSSQVKEMFEYVEKTFSSTVDILVNNAGITKDNLLMRMSNEEFDKVIDINLKGAFYCMRQATKGMMKKRYGKIINMSSVVGFAGNPGQINYVASKAGIHGMTKTMAQELGTRGVRVNSIAPGFIATDMTDKLSDDMKKIMEAQTSLKSLGTVDDIISGKS